MVDSHCGISFEDAQIAITILNLSTDGQDSEGCSAGPGIFSIRWIIIPLNTIAIILAYSQGMVLYPL